MIGASKMIEQTKQNENKERKKGKEHKEKIRSLNEDFGGLTVTYSVQSEHQQPLINLHKHIEISDRDYSYRLVKYACFNLQYT